MEYKNKKNLNEKKVITLKLLEKDIVNYQYADQLEPLDKYTGFLSDKSKHRATERWFCSSNN